MSSNNVSATLAVGAVAGALGLQAARHFSSNSNLSALNSSITSSNSKNVGILAMQVYTPATYIAQSELEEHAGVSSGRYTIGLGQEGLGVVCGDAEDINSICLTVVHSLLEKYQINPNDVGRLEVGTETLVDKSKSTKTVLMDLFPNNSNVEGATVINACYGGTAALLNAMMWVESDGWDGRYAIVVAGDIAAYARGPARPTCGAGAVAVLVGRDAPLVFAPRERATHASNVWDFFKPDPTVEYPTVDGALSQTCYYKALEDVYERFCQKMEERNGDSNELFDATKPDYMVFHAPYNKLVQKSYARLFLLDARRKYNKKASEQEGGDLAAAAEPNATATSKPSSVEAEEKKEPTNGSDDTDPIQEALAAWLTKPIEETYSDRALDGALKKLAKADFAKRLADANLASKLVGNTYTASVFLGLASLVDQAGGRGELTPGKSLVVFSYGSGALATMYRLSV